MNIAKIIMSIAACAAITSIYAQRDDIRAFGRAWQTYMASPDRMQVDEVIAIYNDLRPGNKQIADERMRTDLGVTIRDLQAMQLATRGPGDPAVRRQLEQALADVTAYKMALERAHKDTRSAEAEIARLNELLKGVPVTPTEPTIPPTPLKPPIRPVEPGTAEREEFEVTFAGLKNATSSNFYQMGDSFVMSTANVRPYVTSMETSKVANELSNMLMMVQRAPKPLSPQDMMMVRKLAYWYTGYKNLTNGRIYPGVCDALKDHQDVLGDLIEVCRSEMPTIPPTPIKPVVPVEKETEFERTVAALKNATSSNLYQAGDSFVMTTANLRPYATSMETAKVATEINSMLMMVQRAPKPLSPQDMMMVRKLAYWYTGYKNLTNGRTYPGVCDALKDHQDVLGNLLEVCRAEMPTIPVTPIKPPVKPVEPVMTPKEMFDQALAALKEATGTAIDEAGQKLVMAAKNYRPSVQSGDISAISMALVADRNQVQSMWVKFFGGKEDAVKRLAYWYEAYKILSGRTIKGICDLFRAHENIINNFTEVCGDEPATPPDKPLTPTKPPVTPDKPVTPTKTPQEMLMELYNGVQEAKGWVNGSIVSPHTELSDDVRMLDERIAALESLLASNSSLSLTKDQKDLFDEAKSVANANRG